MCIVVKNTNVVTKHLQGAVSIISADRITYLHKCKTKYNCSQMNEKTSFKPSNIYNEKKEVNYKDDWYCEREKSHQPKLFRRNKYTEVTNNCNKEKNYGKRFFHCLAVIVFSVMDALINLQIGSLK